MRGTAAVARNGREASQCPETPGYDDRSAQSAVLAYLVNERPGGERIPELSRRFSLSEEGDVIERAIRELVRARLLCIEHGKVVLDLSPVAGGSE